MAMTTKQASEKWGISDRRVRVLCLQGKIDGAWREGKLWFIPDSAPKPSDGRYKRKESLIEQIIAKKAELDKRRPLTAGELERLNEDFAAVDVREELCYHSRPKKQIQEVHGTGIKPMKESIARRKKRQPIPKRVSGDGSAPPRFRFGFPCCSCCLFRGVCLAAARVSAPHLSMTSTRHGAK